MEKEAELKDILTEMAKEQRNLKQIDNILQSLIQHPTATTTTDDHGTLTPQSNPCTNQATDQITTNGNIDRHQNP